MKTFLTKTIIVVLAVITVFFVVGKPIDLSETYYTDFQLLYNYTLEEEDLFFEEELYIIFEKTFNLVDFPDVILFEIVGFNSLEDPILSDKFFLRFNEVQFSSYPYLFNIVPVLDFSLVYNIDGVSIIISVNYNEMFDIINQGFWLKVNVYGVAYA